MKIYFTASSGGREQYKEEYGQIVETLKELGAQVLDGSALSGQDEGNEGDKSEIYQKRNSLLKTADFMVAEISYPSVAVGYEISTALGLGKPVLALRAKGTRSNILEGHPDEKFRMIEYDQESLRPVLEKWIKSASDLIDVRFNFFVSPKIIKYLDWIAKQRRIPRSVYLRDLIEKDMKANSAYKESSS